MIILLIKSSQSTFFLYQQFYNFFSLLVPHDFRLIHWIIFVIWQFSGLVVIFLVFMFVYFACNSQSVSVTAFYLWCSLRFSLKCFIFFSLFFPRHLCVPLADIITLFGSSNPRCIGSASRAFWHLPLITFLVYNHHISFFFSNYIHENVRSIRLK